MADGYIRVQIGSRWPLDWPTDDTVVHIVRADGTLRPLSRKQQAAVDFLLTHENVGYRDAGRAVGLSHSLVHDVVHLVGLERVVTWRLGQPPEPEEET